MPLLRKKSRYRAGDLLVSYFIDHEWPEDDLGSFTKYEIYPYCIVAVCTYKDSIGQALANLWTGFNGIEEGDIVVRVREHAHLMFDTDDYTGYFRHWPPTGYREWTYYDTLGLNSILGVVCGTLDIEDPDAVREYLTQVSRTHRDFFMERLTESMIELWDEFDEVDY